MKIVINVDFGSFGNGVEPEFENFIDENYKDRTNPDLVAFVEEHPKECGDLDIVEIQLSIISTMSQMILELYILVG